MRDKDYAITRAQKFAHDTLNDKPILGNVGDFILLAISRFLLLKERIVIKDFNSKVLFFNVANDMKYFYAIRLLVDAVEKRNPIIAEPGLSVNLIPKSYNDNPENDFIKEYILKFHKIRDSLAHGHYDIDYTNGIIMIRNTRKKTVNGKEQTEYSVDCDLRLADFEVFNTFYDRPNISYDEATKKINQDRERYKLSPLNNRGVRNIKKYRFFQCLYKFDLKHARIIVRMSPIMSDSLDSSDLKNNPLQLAANDNIKISSVYNYLQTFFSNRIETVLGDTDESKNIAIGSFRMSKAKYSFKNNEDFNRKVDLIVEELKSRAKAYKKSMELYSENSHAGVLIHINEKTEKFYESMLHHFSDINKIIIGSIRNGIEHGNVDCHNREMVIFNDGSSKQVIDDKQLTSDNTGNLFAMSADPQYLCDVVDGLYELTKLNPDMEKIPSLGFHEMLEELEYILKISGKNKEFIEFMQVYREAMALYNTAIKEKQTDLVTVLKNVANQRSR